MNNIDIKYSNVNIDIVDSLLNNDTILLNQIQKAILDLSSINIVNNEDYIKKLIFKANRFKEKKKDFIVFGIGGSNLGAKALINLCSETALPVTSPVPFMVFQTPGGIPD